MVTTFRATVIMPLNDRNKFWEAKVFTDPHKTIIVNEIKGYSSANNTFCPYSDLLQICAEFGADIRGY